MSNLSLNHLLSGLELRASSTTSHASFLQHPILNLKHWRRDLQQPFFFPRHNHDSGPNPNPNPNPGEWQSKGGSGLMLALALTLSVATATPSSSMAAADPVKTYTCVLNECRVELAHCIMDPVCASNLACIETCNGRPNDAECQIGCGNIFQNKVVDNFNECVLSRKKCVSQRPDDGSFPAPSLNAIVQSFKLSDFGGNWYISSGLNPTFDTFDCQLHNFSSSANKLIANLTWRVKTPDDGFISRSDVQTFVQDSNHPGILYNHDNELLHYQDDWYILSAKTNNEPDDYIFVYYRGKNDAWSAYGGAIVYTRTRSLPSSIVPNLEAAAKKAGLDFSKFQATDNSCQLQAPLLARLGKKLKEGEEALIRGVKEKVENAWAT